MKKYLKDKFLNKSLLLKVYRKLYWWSIYRKRGYPKVWEFDLIKAFANHKSDVKFIQIGSNNGLNGDPICEYIKLKGWRGVLVEPVPQIFNDLKENYSGFEDKLFFENSAIAHNRGTLKFYRLKNPPNQPQWYSQLGSFKKEVIIKHRNEIPTFDELLVEDSVNTITFNDLLQKYSLQTVDFIHIDTEGFDYEILKLIPFADLDVSIVMFEHIHLSRLDYKQAQKLLNSFGYKVRRQGKMDTIAVKKSTLQTIISKER